MNCDCQTGCRKARLALPTWDGNFAFLLTLKVGDNWTPSARDHTILIDIGPDRMWKSIHDVATFLKTILTEREFDSVTIEWVQSGCKGNAQSQPELIPLGQVGPNKSAQLYEMIESGRLESWFQPIFDFDTLEPWGFECLVRGRTEDGTLVNPFDLLSWAETEHLMFTFDRVCRELHIESIGKAGLPQSSNILINFIPTAIYDPAFCLRTTEAAVKRAGIDPRRIIFEAVESEEVTDREHLVNVLQYYRNNGYRIALDDVGSGYAGLGMIADINPDLIKIDRSLVQKAVTSEMHRFVCQSLVQLGRQTKKMVLAEGIETTIEREFFRELGVNLVQGFLFGKPSRDPMKALAECPADR